MLPTIPDGSLMVVDRSELEISHGCVSAFIVGKRLLVKRARWRSDGQLELVSDNTNDAYPVELIGREYRRSSPT